MRRIVPALALAVLSPVAWAADTPVVPDWAYPGSPTHVQVAPPPDFVVLENAAGKVK